MLYQGCALLLNQLWLLLLPLRPCCFVFCLLLFCRSSSPGWILFHFYIQLVLVVSCTVRWIILRHGREDPSPSTTGYVRPGTRASIGECSAHQPNMGCAAMQSSSDDKCRPPGTVALLIGCRRVIAQVRVIDLSPSPA